MKNNQILKPLKSIIVTTDSAAIIYISKEENTSKTKSSMKYPNFSWRIIVQLSDSYSCLTIKRLVNDVVK